MKQKLVNNVVVDEFRTCKCGQTISWTLYPEKKLLGFYCNACGFKSKLETYEEYINPATQNAPWRKF